MTEPCPKEKCFHYVKPGGHAEVSGKRFKDVKEAVKKGVWKKFPDGGCACSFGKCNRIDPEGEHDLYEPLD